MRLARGALGQPDALLQLTTGSHRRLEIFQHAREFCGEFAIVAIHEYVLHTAVLKQMLQEKK